MKWGQAFILTVLLISPQISTGDQIEYLQNDFDGDLLPMNEYSRTKLTAKIDVNEQNNLLYLETDHDNATFIRDLEPDLSRQENATASLKFAFQNAIDSEGTNLLNSVAEEDVTERPVYEFHYNFQIDSNGNIHTAYIADNWTLFYSIRDAISGIWTETQLTYPNFWWSGQPYIELGSNDLPRIVYAVKYQEGALEFWGTDPNDFTPNALTFIHAIHYTYLDEFNKWFTIDVTDNHTPDPNPFVNNLKDQTKLRVYNPGMLIADGKTFIAYNNRVGLNVQSRVQYLVIDEVPSEEFINSGDTPFYDITHEKVRISSTISTIYSRPQMLLLPERNGNLPIVMGFGAWTFGGATFAYLENAFDLQSTNQFNSVWGSFEVDPNLRSRPVQSVDLHFEENTGLITMVWSVFDRYNRELNLYDFDIRALNIDIQDFYQNNPDENSFDISIATEVQFHRLTFDDRDDNANIENIYPNIVEINNKIRIVFLSNYYSFLGGVAEDVEKRSAFFDLSFPTFLTAICLLFIITNRKMVRRRTKKSFV